MLLTGCRLMALRLLAIVVLILGIVGGSSGQQPTVAPRDTHTPGAPSAPQTPPKPQRPTESLESLFGASKGLPPIDRLAGTPNMFGDLFAGGIQLAVATPAVPTAGTFDLPLAGGMQRLKVSEDNSALVQDRVVFLYNHYHDALDEDASGFAGNPVPRSLSVDRYTLGAEKILGDGVWSVELLMPLAGETSFATDAVSVAGGDIGNLAVILKRVVYQCDCTVVSVGLGVDTPTGSDVHGRVDTTELTVHNGAVYLTPYAAFLHKPTDDFFYQGFLEVDVPTNGNRIDSYDVVDGPGTFGTLRDQTFLYVDLSAGYWLYRNRCSDVLTGLASLAELHYSTAMENPESVAGMSGDMTSQLRFGNFSGSSDVLNLTLGAHAEFGEVTICRVGWTLPLGTGDNRSFDSELQVQLERRF